MESKILSAFHAYINAFNGEDIEGIKNALHPEVKVEFNGAVVVHNRDQILPTYPPDFATHKRVE
ncbi:hypothetical protein KIPB_010965, partial [Kipferlia bialata]|eukprot:g10965.t1